MDAKLLPIHHVVTKMQRINCGVSKDASGLEKNVGDGVKNVVKGEIVRTVFHAPNRSLAYSPRP